MADVHPFRGIQYNPSKIKEFSEVVAPPYDIISPAEQENHYAKSPYNVIRLILGKEFPPILILTTAIPGLRVFLRSGRKPGC